MGTDDERAIEFVDRGLASIIRQLSEGGDAGAAHMEADDIILGIAEKHGFVETAEAFRGMKRWHS